MNKNVVVLLAALIAPALAADPLVLESPSSQISLLELYTSEGCSSCPAADRWVSRLKQDERLWTQIVPVAFHVDYWDYIGWKDRFASTTYSQRQRDYARSGSVRTVYTPGFVVNGAEWRRWFTSPRLTLEPGRDVGRLTVAVEGENTKVEFLPTQPRAGSLKLNLAVLGFDLTSAVRAGENNGRTLEHDFVVLGFAQAPMERAGEVYRVDAALPELVVGAKRTAVAAWVSSSRDQTPIQAVGGWLP